MSRIRIEELEDFGTGRVIRINDIAVGSDIEELEQFNADLTNPDKGAAMVARGVVAVDSIADLLALPEGQRKEGLRYLVKGYYAGSDAGGGNLYYDPSRIAENDGGTVFNGFVRVPVGGVTLEQFGVTEGGSVTAVLPAALQAASRLRTSISTTLKSVTLEGANSATDVEYLDADFGGCEFNCNSPIGSSYSLRIMNVWRYLVTESNNNITVGDSYIDIDGDTSRVSTGDILTVHSNEVYNPQRPTTFFVTNTFLVDRVEGQRVYLSRSVYNDFDASIYTVTLRFSKPITGPGLRGAKFTGQGAANSNGVDIYGLVGGEVNDVVVRNFKEHGLVLSLGIASKILNSWAYDIDDTVLGYGLMLNSCIQSEISRSGGSHCRHSVEVGGASEDCLVDRNEVSFDTSSGIASHGNARRVTFSRNNVFMCGGGITSRGEEPVFEDNTIVGDSGLLLAIGEVGNPERVGLAGVRARFKGVNRIVGLPGARTAVQISVTLEDAVLDGIKIEGEFTGTGVLINGEKCERVSCSGIDTSKAFLAEYGMNLSCVSPDSVDILLRDCNIVADNSGLAVSNGCQGPNSEVRIFGGTCSGSRNRPFEMITPGEAGSLKVLLVHGVSLRGAANARKPAAVAEFSELGNIGREIF